MFFLTYFSSENEHLTYAHQNDGKKTENTNIIDKNEENERVRMAASGSQ